MTKTPGTETGANIRAELARRGLTQTSLAAPLGISQGQLSKRLSGAIPLSVDELAQIAAVLGVPLSVLLPGASEQASA